MTDCQVFRWRIGKQPQVSSTLVLHSTVPFRIAIGNVWRFFEICTVWSPPEPTIYTLPLVSTVALLLRRLSRGRGASDFAPNPMSESRGPGTDARAGQRSLRPNIVPASRRPKGARTSDPWDLVRGARSISTRARRSRSETPEEAARFRRPTSRRAPSGSSPPSRFARGRRARGAAHDRHTKILALHPPSRPAPFTHTETHTCIIQN